MIGGIRQKYQSFMWNLSNDPFQLICQFRAIFNFICGLCGLDVYYSTFRVHWVTIIAIVTSCNYVVFSIYTIWYFRDDPVQYLQVLCCYGVFVPVEFELHSIFDLKNINSALFLANTIRIA